MKQQRKRKMFNTTLSKKAIFDLKILAVHQNKRLNTLLEEGIADLVKKKCTSVGLPKRTECRSSSICKGTFFVAE